MKNLKQKIKHLEEINQKIDKQLNKQLNKQFDKPQQLGGHNINDINKYYYYKYLEYKKKYLSLK